MYRLVGNASRQVDQAAAGAGTDVGDHGAGLQHGLDGGDRRQPGGDQEVVEVARAEPFHAIPPVVGIRRLRDPAAVAEGVGHLVDHGQGAEHHVEHPADEGGAALCGEHLGMRSRQRERARRRVVADVVRTRHRGEPLPDVALVEAGGRRQLGGRERARAGQVREQAEAVTDGGEDRRRQAGEVAQHPALELADCGLVDVAAMWFPCSSSVAGP